ncbi:chorismate mutase [Candidatus Bathyarchaeota archaeon]|nr:MAG: chorismate mutase [Candidatus Bathyarchaeota archaeon]
MTYEEEIGEFRREINRLNEEIVEKLARRVEVAVKIGAVKRRHGRPIVDRSREARVYQQIRGLAERRHLDPDGVERVFREIIRLCTEAQTEGRP